MVLLRLAVLGRGAGLGLLEEVAGRARTPRTSAPPCLRARPPSGRSSLAGEHLLVQAAVERKRRDTQRREGGRRVEGREEPEARREQQGRDGRADLRVLRPDSPSGRRAAVRIGMSAWLKAASVAARRSPTGGRRAASTGTSRPAWRRQLRAEVESTACGGARGLGLAGVDLLAGTAGPASATKKPTLAA